MSDGGYGGFSGHFQNLGLESSLPHRQALERCIDRRQRLARQRNP
jgi:hypothetical protein